MARPSATTTRWQLPHLPIPSRADVPSVDVETMRAADRIATDELGLTLLQMMENAGLQLAELTRLTLGGTVDGRSVVVLAGTGNNGGGGLAAARRLAGWGADVCVVFAKPVFRLRPAPCAQLEPMLAAGARAGVAGHDLGHDELRGEVERADAVLDAVIGYSLHGAPDDEARSVIELATAGRGPVVLSLDVPSGVDASSGDCPGTAATADATLTLAVPKLGLTAGEGARRAGGRYLADIGMPSSVFSRLGIDATGLFASGPITRLA